MARGRRDLPTPPPGIINVPLDGEDLPEGPFTVRISLDGRGAMGVGGTPDSTVVDIIHARDDGLEMVSVDDGVVYERATALDRYRIATEAVVAPSRAERLRRLRRELDDDVVVLDETPGSAGGGVARIVSVDQSDPDDREVVVNSDGSTYLVVADAFRDDWSATIDGEPVDLMRADHAFMAVVIPDGRHTVRFTYSMPAWPASGWVSVGAAAFLLAVVITAALVRRHRARAAPPEPAGGSPDDIEGSQIADWHTIGEGEVPEDRREVVASGDGDGNGKREVAAVDDHETAAPTR
jgi:hypothetical protein